MRNFLKNIGKWILPYNLIVHYKRFRAAVKKTSQHWKPLLKKCDECLLVANGPSTSATLAEFEDEKKNVDIITINKSLGDEKIRALKPCAHVCIDPLFFTDYNIKNNLISDLKKVDWPLNFYVHEFGYPCFNVPDLLTSNIELRTVPIQIPPFAVDKKVRFKYYEEGKFGCGGTNVTVAALFLAVNAGYKRIYTAGMDASFRNSIKIDKNCRLVWTNNHFYETPKAESPVNATLAFYYFNELNFILQLELLNEYAAFKNCKIVNLSLNSMHDVFAKGELDGSTYENMRKQIEIDCFKYLNNLQYSPF